MNTPSDSGFRQLGSVLLAFCATGIAVASTNAPSSSGSSATPSAYIEQPQTATTVTTYSPGFYSPSFSSSYYGGFSGNYYGSGYWNGGWGGTYSTTVYYPRRYFFPPTPPALGEPYLKNRTKAASTSLSRIPLKLSEYVNEPFFAPVSPFLFEEDLSKSRERKINDYMLAKEALVKELRTKLDSLRGADPATRESQLAQFAQEQTPRVIQVENMAYAIRDDLTRWRLFSDSSDWNEARDWRLGDDTRWESTMDEAKVMRGAAYFQEGLSPAQRRLLREYAMELDDSSKGVTNDIGLEVRGPYFYFAPETSRIRLPANMPADLQEKIASYSRQKSALKKELRDVLYREDRRWFNSSRTAALRQLAEAQAARIAALEPLAEEIRRGLAPLPNPARPRQAMQGLPGSLADRVSAFMERRAEFQRTMNDRLQELKRQFPSSRAEFVKMNGGFGIQLVANRKLKGDELSRFEAAAQQITAFNDQQVNAYTQLVREKEAIREALIQSAGSNLGPMMTSRIVDLILREYGTTLAVEELWRQYRDYDAAVLQPGLSPEQRRMLYDAALVKLDQQLLPYTY